MKLFEKYSRINLFATLIVFLLASASFFLLLRYIIIEQVDEDLEIEQNEIELYVSKNHQLPEPIQLRDQQIEYIKTATPLYRNKPEYKTVDGHNAGKKNDNSFRELSFNISVDGDLWLVKVRKSLEETDNLVHSILVIIISAVLLILIITFLINRILLKKLWQPFYETLDSIKSFKLSDRKKLALRKTGIDEFDILNNTLEQSIGKATLDYELLKEFTENASHELQTPLAVIRSKLDILIQDENLSEQQSTITVEAYEAIKRLSKLNQSLLLLARIENNQYYNIEKIDLAEKLKTKLQQFSELYKAKNIHVSSIIDESYINIDTQLADILLNNILSNAIKHNVENGFVEILLQQRKLVVINTGTASALNRERLFTRFYKETVSNENTGLGLSVVKQICDVSNITINYAFSQNKHRFTLSW